jgi:hypothetical protein
LTYCDKTAYRYLKEAGVLAVNKRLIETDLLVDRLRLRTSILEPSQRITQVILKSDEVVQLLDRIKSLEKLSADLLRQIYERTA